MAAPQYLYGNAEPVLAAFDTTDANIAFNPGDLLGLSSGNAVTIGTGTVTTNFLGVAAQTKKAGTTGTAIQLFGNSTSGVMRVDTGGTWEYDRSDTPALSVGDLMGTDGTTANTLKKVGAASIAVGVIVKPSAANSARCRIRVLSAKVPLALNT